MLATPPLTQSQATATEQVEAYFAWAKSIRAIGPAYPARGARGGRLRLDEVPKTATTGPTEAEPRRLIKWRRRSSRDLISRTAAALPLGKTQAMPDESRLGARERTTSSGRSPDGSRQMRPDECRARAAEQLEAQISRVVLSRRVRARTCEDASQAAYLVAVSEAFPRRAGQEEPAHFVWTKSPGQRHPHGNSQRFASGRLRLDEVRKARRVSTNSPSACACTSKNLIASARAGTNLLDRRFWQD